MLFGGIDWSDSVLDFHLRTGDGQVLEEGEVQPSVEGLAELFMALESHGSVENIGIAIETAHGAWVQALLDRGYKVYPVNPKTVERFREALSAAGDKSDKMLNAEITERDKQITEQLNELPEANWIRSLPGPRHSMNNNVTPDIITMQLCVLWPANGSR